MKVKSMEDAPVKEPMRPHHLGWAAKYADRNWFSSSKFNHARHRKIGKRRKGGARA